MKIDRRSLLEERLAGQREWLRQAQERAEDAKYTAAEALAGCLRIRRQLMALDREEGK